MIFLTGPHAAGKTTSAKILSRYGFVYIELGAILRRVHLKEGEGVDFEKWLQRGEIAFGIHFTDDILVEEIKKKMKRTLYKSAAIQDIVIVGSRSFQGIQYIINKTPIFNKRKNIIIYMDSPVETLKARYSLRTGKQFDSKEFQLLLDKDYEIGLKTIIRHADFKIWNNGSKGDLKRKLKTIIFSDLNYLNRPNS